MSTSIQKELDRRQRENFCEAEKNMILKFVLKNKSILEFKGSDSRKGHDKKNKWVELQDEIKACGYHRGWIELRAAYQRWKVSAKKSVTAYRQKFMLGTGGGPPLPCPSETDFAIADICPEDFEIDSNPADSDGALQNNIASGADRIIADDDSVFYVLDPITGELNPEIPEVPLHPRPSAKRKSDENIEKLDEEMVKTQKKKRIMTEYEEQLLQLQKNKYLQISEYLKIEHEAKMEHMRLEEDILKLKKEEATYHAQIAKFDYIKKCKKNTKFDELFDDN